MNTLLNCIQALRNLQAGNCREQKAYKRDPTAYVKRDPADIKNCDPNLDDEDEASEDNGSVKQDLSYRINGQVYGDEWFNSH